MHITEEGRRRHILDVNTEVDFVQAFGLNLSSTTLTYMSKKVSSWSRLMSLNHGSEVIQSRTPVNGKKKKKLDLIQMHLWLSANIKEIYTREIYIWVDALHSPSLVRCVRISRWFGVFLLVSASRTSEMNVTLMCRVAGFYTLPRPASLFPEARITFGNSCPPPPPSHRFPWKLFPLKGRNSRVCGGLMDC